MGVIRKATSFARQIVSRIGQTLRRSFQTVGNFARRGLQFARNAVRLVTQTLNKVINSVVRGVFSTIQRLGQFVQSSLRIPTQSLFGIARVGFRAASALFGRFGRVGFRAVSNIFGRFGSLVGRPLGLANSIFRSVLNIAGTLRSLVRG